MISLILFAALMSDPTASAAAPTAAEPPKKEERIICKTRKFVGSNLSRKVCMTEGEWRDGRQNAQDALLDIGRGNDYRRPTGPNQ